MIAARRAYRERARTPPEPVARGGTGGGGAIQLGTISKKASDYDSQNEMTSSLEELVSSGDSGRSLVGQSKVVGILLSIAMVSVLIAVASLAPSLYSVTVIHTRRVSCAHEVRSNCAMNTGSPNQTTPLQLNNQVRGEEDRGGGGREGGREGERRGRGGEGGREGGREGEEGGGRDIKDSYGINITLPFQLDKGTWSERF